MTLDIDTGAALRGIGDLRRLVQAILAASPDDEADWVEWKSGLDLATREGCFAVARAVLGLANRLPERAGQTCEGLGYVVVGAEPGNPCGVASVDPAITDQYMEQYLGSGMDGPQWTPVYVPGDSGESVFVVTVEAPKAGDKIFTLRKELGKNSNGRVFVRKHGCTVPANAADMDALQRRLTTIANASGVDLQVRFVGQVPIMWVDLPAVTAALEQWAHERRRELLDGAAAIDRATHVRATRTGGLVPPVVAQAALYSALLSANSLSSLRGEPDLRTLDEYTDQVEDWTSTVQTTAVLRFIAHYLRTGNGRVALNVSNQSGRFLPDVEVNVSLNRTSATIRARQMDVPDLPGPPRGFGEPKPPPGLFGPHLSAAALGYGRRPELGGIRQRTCVDEDKAGVRFAAGDLRPLGSDTSNEFYLLVSARPTDGILKGKWTATFRNMDGVLTGTIELPVVEQPVDLEPLLKVVTDPRASFDPES